MIPLIQNNIQAIRELCKKHHVKTFYLVGSAAKENSFHDDSDVDFLYRFKNEEIEEFDHADNYFDLLFALQDLLNRKVDLVAEVKMKNPYFIKSINQSKRIIYEA
jgi:predicted nucleotidyltransferase